MFDPFENKKKVFNLDFYTNYIFISDQSCCC